MSLNESTWRTAHAQDAGWTLFESFFIHLPFLFLCHNFHDKKKNDAAKSVQNFKWLGLFAFCYFYICFKESHMDFFVFRLLTSFLP